MKNEILFFFITLILVACSQGQGNVELLNPAKDNTEYRFWEIGNNYCGETPHWFKYVNDSTTVHIYYGNLAKNNKLVPNQFKLSSEFWEIDGFVHPTKKELTRILKDYHIELSKFEITQTDSLRYKIKNVMTNDEFDAYFSLDKLIYYEMSNAQKKGYYIEEKNKFYNCKPYEIDGKYGLSIDYFNRDETVEFW